MKKDKLCFLRHLAVLVLVLVGVLCLSGISSKAAEDDDYDPDLEYNEENEYEQYEGESNDYPGQGDELTLNYSYFDETYVMHGYLDFHDTRDYFTFELTKRSFVKFTIYYSDKVNTNAGNVWAVQLFTPGMALMDERLLKHESVLDSLSIGTTLDPGKYYFCVKLFPNVESEAGSYFMYLQCGDEYITSITPAKVTGISNKTYTGSPIKPKPVVKYDGKVLQEGIDYTLSYSNNTKIGTATVKIKGIGLFNGTITKTFKITPISISSATVTGISSQTYAGAPVTMKSITVKCGGKTLKSGTDYTIAYKNNNAAGTATVTITGKGNYAGSISRTFKINPGSGLITAAASMYTAATGSGNSGKAKEGTAVKLYQKQNGRWKVLAGGKTFWVIEDYIFDLATSAPKASDRIGQGVTVKEVKVYASPAAKGTPVCTLKAGITRNLYAQSGNWYQIYTGGKYAWVRVDGFDYTQALSSKPIKQITAKTNLQTYYGPGIDYEKSIIIPQGKTINVYKQVGNWSLVYRTGKYLWVKQTS